VRGRREERAKRERESLREERESQREGREEKRREKTNLHVRVPRKGRQGLRALRRLDAVVDGGVADALLPEHGPEVPYNQTGGVFAENDKLGAGVSGKRVADDPEQGRHLGAAGRGG
jgi:hypothetical protein